MLDGALSFGFEVRLVRSVALVTFVSDACTKTPEGYDVSGNLTLHGVAKRIALSARAEGGHHVAEVTLNQPDFGITPFKAMMGTIEFNFIISSDDGTAGGGWLAAAVVSAVGQDATALWRWLGIVGGGLPSAAALPGMVGN